jgi:hypothetical protein
VHVKGSFRLVVLAAAVSAMACSDAKSLVGVDEDEESSAQSLTIAAERPTVPPGGSTTVTFEVSGKNGRPVKDGTEVEVTSLKLGRVDSTRLRTQGGGRASTVYRAPASPGAEQLVARSGDVTETLSLTIAQGAAAPAPPPPPPPPPPGGGSTIDLNTVTWLHTNVSRWAQTSQITSTSIGNPPICIGHTKAGKWPVKDRLEGNPWVFVNLNGRWYAATYEWLAPGQTCKGIHAGNIGSHIGVPPLNSWRPRSGEVIGLMVSARARSGGDTVHERSNIVMVRWP